MLRENQKGPINPFKSTNTIEYIDEKVELF